MSSKIIAALDLGSNTFRLMLAEINKQNNEKQAKNLWQNRKAFQHIPRLSDHLVPGGKFAPEALDRAWEALDDFQEKINNAGAEKILAGATMAARLASDGPEFIGKVAKKYGWETLILSGDQEAELTTAGVLSVLSPLPQNGLIVDIGGRSTEFISTKKSKLNKSRSLSVGVVELSESYLSDPIAPGELEILSKAINKSLTEADFSDIGSDFKLIGTAGTVLTVAFILLKLNKYEPDLINNSIVDKQSIANLLNEMVSFSLSQRIEKYKLHPRRADAIVAGLLMLLEIMIFFNKNELIVSDSGLLEGLWMKAAVL